MNPPSPMELPVRVVGKREKTVEERFAEIQRHGRLYRRKPTAKIEVQQSDGSWTPYVRGRKSGTA